MTARLGVDNVTLTSMDDDTMPPEKILRVHAHPRVPNDPTDALTLEACDHDETTDSVTESIVGSFYFDLETFVETVNYLFDEQVLTYTPSTHRMTDEDPS